MVNDSDSENGDGVGRSRLKRALALVNECYDNLFERSPIMMHSIDQYWKLIGVNRKWLATHGYEAADVLGRRSIEFLSEESRAAAVSETFPPFWRAGSARSVGYEMVRKDGRVLDVLLDADLDTDPTGTRRTLATIRESHDRTGWQCSSATLHALLGLAQVRRAIEAILANDGAVEIGSSSNPADSADQSGSGGRSDLSADLLEAVVDASAALHTLGSILANWAGSMESDDAEVFMLAESVAELCGKLQWLTISEQNQTP